MVISNNTYLTLPEMTENAQYILDNLLANGWTKNAICGMLGNMQTESTINPGLWQSFMENNMNVGFGLVQWTPASKYISWATSNMYDRGDIDGQLIRLQFEIDNKIQWIKTKGYPMTFQEFKVSTYSPEYLAQAFLKNYERPKNQNQPNRSTQARYWYDNLTGGGGVLSKPFFPTKEGTPVSSNWGWRKDPFTGEDKFHDGTDFASGGAPFPIYATQTGKIIRNSFNDIAGYHVRIEHTGDQYFSGYQHLALKSTVKEGSTIQKGEQIGLMGTTGSSTGVHLHFQIANKIDGWYTETGTIDPLIYLEMEFDGGGNDPKPPNENDLQQNIISLLLCDALNGWKW